jgi:hypothetical protein
MDHSTPTTISPWQLMLLFCAVAVFSRLIPHPWNATPNLALTLVIAQALPRRRALLLSLIAILLSDIALGFAQGHAMLGGWSLFTYSGWIAVCITSGLLTSKRITARASLVIGASMGFWLWTNIGAWLCSPIYSKTPAGLLTSLTMGLPFLRQALLGDILWSTLFIVALHYHQQRITKQSFITA